MMSTPMNGAASRLKDGREGVLKRRIFDAVFLLGFLCCLVPGAMPSLTVYVSALLVLCIAVCFFDENFYLYTALFMYMRYTLWS